MRFSCVIPTKNRSFLLPGLLESLWSQSFEDFEVVVLDNDDSNATEEVLRGQKDSRLRCVRTGGLPMWANWDAAIKSAKGEYVVMLYDKMRLRAGVLTRVNNILESENASVLTWRSQGCASEEEAGRCDKIQSKELRKVQASSLMADAAAGKWKGFNRLAPRGVNGAIKRSLIDDVEKKWGRPISQPGSPDYVIAFTLLLSMDSFYHIDEVFYDFLLNAPSNGGDALGKRDSAVRIAKNMGCSVEDLCRYVPVKYLSSNNVILNDLLKVLSERPELLKKFPISWPCYYFELIQEILQMEDIGVDATEERALLKHAFRKQRVSEQVAFIKESLHEFSWQVKNKERRRPAWDVLVGRLSCAFN